MKFTICGKGLTLHYLAVVGSVAHGLKNASSDLDLKGVFSWDLSIISGLNKVQDSLEASNVPENDWNHFLYELKNSLNISIELDDDITFMDARKFVINARKNELNMLDLLFSNEVIYSSPSFNYVLENRKRFLNLKYARSRFIGMSQGCIEERNRAIRRIKNIGTKSFKSIEDKNLFLKKNKYSSIKNLARSLHVLYILEEYLLTGIYKSKIANIKRLEYIKKIRNFEVSEVEVLNKRDSIIKDILLIELSESEDNSFFMNEFVVHLNMLL